MRRIINLADLGSHVGAPYSPFFIKLNLIQLGCVQIDI